MTTIFRAQRQGRDEPSPRRAARLARRSAARTSTRPASLSSRDAGRERRRHDLDVLLFTVTWIAAWTAFALYLPVNALTAG